MPKRILQGVVISDKQQKTLVVKVERRFTHPLLKKTVRKSKNYHAHVENKTQKVGDTVSIEETKPISKLKRWIVINETTKPVAAKVEAPAAEKVPAAEDAGTINGGG
jgi:small subunit ribosomal protein S17